MFNTHQGTENCTDNSSFRKMIYITQDLPSSQKNVLANETMQGKCVCIASGWFLYIEVILRQMLVKIQFYNLAGKVMLIKYLTYNFFNYKSDNQHDLVYIDYGKIHTLAVSIHSDTWYMYSSIC